jgi:Nucleotidyl transferase AbiEii toxin, Type IV TA system
MRAHGIDATKPRPSILPTRFGMNSFADIRKLTITALFSDDVLFEQIVLKGGNAMSLVYHISPRVSLDLDFSLAADFENVEEVHARMEHVLADRFNSVGLIPFDVRLTPKPSVQREDLPPWWGGYELRFKLADEKRHRSFGLDRGRLRREAFVLGPNQQKVLDFSKREYTLGKIRAELDAYTIYVYSPAMIALEKLRAICQQMDGYAPTGTTKRPRARDFFDVFIIVTKTGLRFDTPESRELLKLIFAAKAVPLSLLANIPEQRNYHRNDWANVRATIAGPLEEFDFYFDFVVREIEPLHSLWVE